MSKVSVIITTKNRLELLKKALKSVLMQTYTDFECIVVVDNSTDGTREYLETITDKRVKTIFIEEAESKGGNYARNKGIDASTGDFLAFLDDDDEWLPLKLEKQIKLFDDQEVGLVFCGHMDEYDDGKMCVKITPADDQQGDLSQFVFKFIFCTTSMMMVRRQLMLSIGKFDENVYFWQEYDVCIRLCQNTKVAFVKEPLMILRHIRADKNRLTNKFEGWVDAVKYQNRKYRKLIHNLSDQYKWDRELMVYIDAAIRCENCGDKRRQRHYLLKIAQMTHKGEDIFRYLFNIGNYRWMRMRFAAFKLRRAIIGELEHEEFYVCRDEFIKKETGE